jgi:hypothetical protein
MLVVVERKGAAVSKPLADVSGPGVAPWRSRFQCDVDDRHRYCNEFTFRGTHRYVTDGERMVAVIRRAEGKRRMHH